MIIYQDKDIVVCEKPYGVSSQKSGGENMVDMLTQLCGCEIYPVHRLDTQTTGLMVYAKSQKSAAALSQAVANGKLKKEYICLCHGTMEGKGEMTDYLYHDRIKNKSFVTKNSRGGSKLAQLKYEVISQKQAGECTVLLVKVELLTGRTHQIRVQFASRGYPLLGDGKYGARDNEKIHLHSSFLSFPHPTTGKITEFYSTPEWSK